MGDSLRAKPVGVVRGKFDGIGGWYLLRVIEMIKMTKNFSDVQEIKVT